MKRAVAGLRRLPLRVHRDQGGTISIAAVFAMLLLAMILGMVINVGLHADNKVKMQNAADASAYSGGLVIARGMNTVAFTNHLLCDVFALTAFMREARARSSESLTPEILAAWAKVGPMFSSSSIPKMSRLGGAITAKVPLEQELVRAFSEWAFASQELILPVLEQILAQELIPQYQRALVYTTPQLAQVATDEIARRHGRGAAAQAGVAAGMAGGSMSNGGGRGRNVREYRGVLWRTIVDPVGGRAEQSLRTLPVVDPVMDAVPGQQQYVDRSREMRQRTAHQYLAQWNNVSLTVFDREAKMSQFANLWRGFTCGQLDRLLEEEYPYSNLLFMIRTRRQDMDDTNTPLERDYTFVSVVHCKKIPELLPGLLRNPQEADAETFAQVMLFVPRSRLRWGRPQQPNNELFLGGVPGGFIRIQGDPPPPPDEDDENPWVYREGRPQAWNAMNQNWTVQLMPARAQRLVSILRTPSRIPGMERFQLPQLPGVQREDLERINTH